MKRGADARSIGARRSPGDSTRRIALGLALIALFAPAGCDLARRDGPGSRPPFAAPTKAPSTANAPQADCTVDFSDRDGWFGGDAATSIVLPGDAGRRSLWLFGDSFVERPGAGAARRYPFVHNAIAISSCEPGRPLAFDFFWGTAAVGGDTRAASPPAEPRAFFEPDPNADWVVQARREGAAAAYYWPLTGAIVRDRLYVALLRVVSAPPRGPFALPFRMAGVDVAHVENPLASPDRWRIRVSTLSSRADVLPSTAWVATPDALYAFATLDRGDGRSPRILARIALAALTRFASNLEPNVETLSRDGSWQRGLEPEGARIVMDDDASEMSVHFDSARGEWLALYSDPTPPRGAAKRADAIWLRSAPRLEGPWSPPTVFARIPELEHADDPLPGEPFCYAAKAHPELSRGGTLLVTYVCNLAATRESDVPAVLERLRTTPALYRPRVVVRDLPTN